MKLLTIGPITVPRSKFVAALWGEGVYDPADLLDGPGKRVFVRLAGGRRLAVKWSERPEVPSVSTLYAFECGAVDIRHVIALGIEGASVSAVFDEGRGFTYAFSDVDRAEEVYREIQRRMSAIAETEVP